MTSELRAPSLKRVTGPENRGASRTPLSESLEGKALSGRCIRLPTITGRRAFAKDRGATGSRTSPTGPRQDAALDENRFSISHPPAGGAASSAGTRQLPGL